MLHVVMLSGGVGSWAAGRRVADRHGTADLRLLFCDTLMEDEDVYRFLLLGAADILGQDLPAEALACLDGLPPVWEPEARARRLAGARAAAAGELPRLVWLADGRDVWQIFFDERYLGNTFADPCSKILKRELADRWVSDNLTPETCVRYVGIDASERRRFEGDARAPGLRKRLLPWRCEAPLLDEPCPTKAESKAEAERRGLPLPSLYDDGFPHANCGGACVKAGQAHWRLLLQRRPEVYAHWERKERELREHLGKDVAILRDRRGGSVKPLPLADFRLRVLSGGECDRSDWGKGCRCFADG